MRSLFISLIVLGLTVCGMAKDAVSVKVDGVISDKEYSKIYDVDKNFKFYVSYDDKNVYVGISANAKGWVSVGFGSPIMDKSVMFIAYFDKGKLVVEEFLGVKHNHVKAEKSSVIEFNGKREGNTTVVEFVLPRKLGEIELKGEVPTIWAYAMSDSIKSYHAKRGSTKVSF